MACNPYTSNSAPRMQTNAAWLSPLLTFKTGTPLVLVDISGWTVDGVAVGAHGRRLELNVANQRIVFDSVNALHIALSATDMGELGVGQVVIEIMRRAPAPIRPLIRMTLQNKAGVA